ncbi:MAG: LptF/LptG family permease, partial [Victivallales bacterium]|nr:LptF/LptG family permease [Victivallales bacterium]
IAALLAFGMTITQGRRSAAGGFVAAVGIFMVYYVVAQLCLVLGKNGTMPPILAGTLPTIISLAAAVIIVKKRQ